MGPAQKINAKEKELEKKKKELIKLEKTIHKLEKELQKLKEAKPPGQDTKNVFILEDAHVPTQVQATTCSTTATSRDEFGDFVNIACDNANNSSGNCKRAYFEWDTSVILANKTIDSIKFTFNTNSLSPAAARNCHIVKFSLNFQPSAKTEQEIYNEITARIANNDFILQDTDKFKPTGNHIDVDLGATAVTDLQQKYANGFWAFAVVLNPETRVGGTDHFTKITSNDRVLPVGSPIKKPKLFVTYH